MHTQGKAFGCNRAYYPDHLTADENKQGNQTGSEYIC